MRRRMDRMGPSVPRRKSPSISRRRQPATGMIIIPPMPIPICGPWSIKTRLSTFLQASRSSSPTPPPGAAGCLPVPAQNAGPRSKDLWNAGPVGILRALPSDSGRANASPQQSRNRNPAIITFIACCSPLPFRLAWFPRHIHGGLARLLQLSNYWRVY